MTEQRFIITENMMDSLYGSDNAKYDQHAKYLLSSRKLLAEIVKKVVPEFQDASIDDIANKYIEGTPLVGSVPVNPGLTNAVPSKISGDRNEDGALKEGYITYDILFHARAPGTGEPITLIINVEAQRSQKESTLGYHLMKRAVFYACRLISSQKEREFEGKDYNSIKKIYSIWICMDSPNRDSYINRYRLEEKHLLHRYEEPQENYDLVNIVLISLGEKADKDRLIHLLQVLFTESQQTFDSKRNILQKEYHIEMTPEMEEEMNTMCNLSLNISEEALNRGLAQGRKEGRQAGLNETALRLLSMGLSVEDVSKGTSLPLETVEEIKKQMIEKINKKKKRHPEKQDASLVKYPFLPPHFEQGEANPRNLPALRDLP